jgi:hypothetical protein
VVCVVTISLVFDPMAPENCWGFPSIAALVHLLGAQCTVTLLQEAEAMIVPPGIHAIYSTGVHSTAKILTAHDGVHYVERCRELVHSLDALVTSRCSSLSYVK